MLIVSVAFCSVIAATAAEPGKPVSSTQAMDDAMTTLVERYHHWGYWYYHYRHRATPYFKGPNVDQSFYDFLVRLPLMKQSLGPTEHPPMVIVLHARSGSFQRHERQWPDHIVVTPDDNTVGIGHSGWFGYHELAPKPPTRETRVVPYTHRRLVHYIHFVMKTFNVDPNRIWVTGASMGGSGALLFALHHPEWVAGAEADRPPIDLRVLPSIRAMAESTFGPPAWDLRVAGTDVSVWQYTSIPWLLSRDPLCRTWLEIHHGRRDQVVPFEQYFTSASPPGRSCLQLLQLGLAPCTFAWDAGSHEKDDPAGGSKPGFHPLAGGLIRMDRPTISFYNPSLGHWGVPGDAGLWEPGQRPDRDPRGMINAFCRWDGDRIVDRPDRFEVSLWLAEDQLGRHEGAAEEITYSVSPRGMLHFPVPPRCRFQYAIEPDGAKGRVISDDSGLLVIEKVPLHRGRDRATRLSLRHDMPVPVVSISSPTHPTIAPRSISTVVARWVVGNSAADDPLPVDRYRCWISPQANAAPPADCETPQTERVFESLAPGRYHIMVQARLITGRWGPVTTKIVNVDRG